MPIPLLIPLAAAGVPLLVNLIKNTKQAWETDDQTLQRLEAERIERERLAAIEKERIKQRNKKYLIAGGIVLVLILLFVFTKGKK